MDASVESKLRKEELADDVLANTLGQVSLRTRLKHFTWAQFLLPLTTAGIGLLLAATPHRFTGLDTIGKIFFIFALVLFVVYVPTITLRFVLHPGTFHCSLMHPHEMLFIPTVLLTVANLLGCAQVYGAEHCGPWFARAMEVCFWTYAAMAFVGAVLQYLHLFCGTPTRLTIQGMTPAWILPIFPMLLSGVLAQLIAPDQPPDRGLPIIVGAISFLGLGWMIAFLMYAAYIHRLMGYGLPEPDLRPGMFISTGPPSFTGLSLIGLGNALPDGFGYFASRPLAVQILGTVADFTAIFFWVLVFWFFCITTIAVVRGAPKMSFHMIWWGAVFPNIGFAIATIKIGEQLASEGILWVGSAMTILLVAGWILVFLAEVRAIIRKDIIMPGKDEDKVCYKVNDEK